MQGFQLPGVTMNHVKIMDASSVSESSSDESAEIVLVAIDASRKITEYALDWALSNLVIQRDDKVVFLAVFPSSNSSAEGWKKWGFPALGGECAATSIKSTKEELRELHKRCSYMVEKLRKSYAPKKAHVTVEIVQFADTGVVSTEARRLKATWVVLDRNLRREAKHCLHELHSNIAVVSHNGSKILRLNLKRRILPLEEPSVDTSSVLLNGLSLPMIPKGFDKLCLESFMDSSSHSSPASSPERPFETPSTSSDFEGRKSTNEARISRRSTQPRGRFASSPSENLPDQRSNIQGPQLLSDFLSLKVTQSPARKAPTRTAEKERQLGETDAYSPLDRVSSVRRQMRLSRNSPPRPPPLCSICQHKAPVFGKPPRKFTFAELQHATAGFSDANFLAEGGFGSVYRGVLPDGQAVAVKQHKLASTQGDKEFCSEVEVLSCAQQRNLVMLIGYCVEERKRLLVYEFVCNGSLDSHLYGKRSRTSTLGWSARQKVAVGAARALRYLHEECRVGCIVHRDMRPNNILLTHDFEPMVGDFGLARWQPDGDLAVQTRVIGAIGYLAPEYTQTGQITEKADVYSFGIVLLELVTGRKAVDMSRNRGELCLSEWARPLLHDHNYKDMIDWRLEGKAPLHEVENMLHAASLCINPDPAVRPRMSQVLRLLEGDLMSDTNSRHDSPLSVLSPISSTASSSGKLHRFNHSSGSSSNSGSPVYQVTKSLYEKYQLRATQSGLNQQTGGSGGS